MTQANPDRIDRIEAQLETVVLAIRELSNRQERTQTQLDQLQGTVNDIARRQEATDRQIAASSEQIASQAAGLVQLQNILADYIRSQG
ncbi:hypothetical protein ACQ4M3_05195 [Leptolyngbya sp. AN03gr2]|uniref:hypothetical protein n=1 Tax=unclassified Leptolyngbya TaxID=2650499 RepID=UPI003D31D723